ncbi:MAG: hypothetical protein ACR2G4_16855 [Pyrinomonadaceae bacterium]
MEETESFTEMKPIDRDATLATPRFDEGEAQVARPVVPLAETPARDVRRRQWPVALVLISALAGGAISIFAFQLYQQRQQPRTAATQVIEPSPEIDAPDSPALAPSPALTVASLKEKTSAQLEAPTVNETFEEEKANAATKDDDKLARRAEKDEVKATRKEDRKDAERRADEKRAERDSEAKLRRVEAGPAPRRIERTAEDGRRYDRADDEEDVEWRRERRRQRREQRRGQQRNIDRIKDIFQGPPPA